MIQEEFRRIIKRFKDYDVYHHVSNKENQYKTQISCRDQSISKEQIIRLNRTIKTLEGIIESMMTDANKMFQYYEQVITESAAQFDSLKEQFNCFRQAAIDEKQQIESVVSELSKKIEMLNDELIDRQQLYNQLLEKCQFLQQKASQVHIEQREIVKQIHLQLIRQSSQNENILIDIIRQKEQLKAKLFESVKMREELQDQNCFLKNTNEELAQNVQFLKNKINAEKAIEYETQDGCIEQFEKCEVGTISRVEQEEDRFTMEEVKLNDSQEINRSREKEILNISQHYSKFNRTEQFQSKEKEMYQFADSHSRISFVRSRFLPQQSKPPLFKIDTNKSKDDTKDKQSSNAREITEIKQFQVSDSPFICTPQINPYHAFFLLLTQCQKMNSPHFAQISHIDLTHLYPSLISRYVPFNLWQFQIRTILDSYI